MVYYPEQTIRVVRPEKEERQVMATLAHLEKANLPVRASTLREIRKQIDSDDEVSAREALTRAARSDPALFRMCTAAIARMRPDNDRPTDLLIELRTWPIEKVRELFSDLANRLDGTVSVSVTGAERRHLERTAVRCVAAHEFAARAVANHRVDSSLVHAAAFFSEIGHTLMAAQYPRLLARIRNENQGRSKRDFSLAIKRQLGVSPEGVGIQLARQAGIPSEVIRELQTQERGTQKSAKELSPIGVALRSGELLADLHESNGSSKAYDAWREFAPTLEVYLGPKGAEKFSEHVTAASAPILAELRHTGLEDRTEELFEEVQARIASNKFLPRCEAGTRSEIERIYGLLKTPGPSPGALNELLCISMARAGFIGGALFRHFEKSHEFKCLMRLGNRAFETYDPSKVFSRWEFAASSEGTQPLRLEVRDVRGNSVDCLFGRFGTRDSSGVLVLELTPELQEDREYTLNHFSALRVTLEECLR